MVYFPSSRVFEEPTGFLPLIHFQSKDGQLRGRMLRWHELNELMNDKSNFRLIDDILRSGKASSDCARHLKQLCNLDSEITVLTVVNVVRDDEYNYQKWLIKHSSVRDSEMK